VEIVLAAGVTMAENVLVRVEGPSNQSREAAPGETLSFEGLPPGTYRISAEGTSPANPLEPFGEERLDWYDESTVTLSADQSPTVRLTARSFQPQGLSDFGNIFMEVGGGVLLTWSPVPNAVSYVVERRSWESPLEAVLEAFTISDPAFFIELRYGYSTYGVRAVNRYGTVSPSAEYDGIVGGHFLRTVTVTKAGQGSGTVTSSPDGISCGSVCTASFKDVGGHQLSTGLTATPDVGSTFIGWSAPCAGPNLSCFLDPSQDVSVTATFEPSGAPWEPSPR
jgi:hypothetical protein